jgi:hypothetical protein
MASLDSRDIDLALSQLDALGDDQTLRAQAEAFTAGQELVPASRYDSADPTQSIWVEVDPRGRFLGVEISRTWTDRMQAAQFADALFSAYSAAVQKAFATELAAGRIEQGAKPATEPRDDRPSGADWLAQAEARLHRIDEDLRRLPTGPAEADREVRSPNGYLTLQLNAGSLSAITGNATALERAHRELLREDVLDVFRRANLTAER